MGGYAASLTSQGAGDPGQQHVGPVLDRLVDAPAAASTAAATERYTSKAGATATLTVTNVRAVAIVASKAHRPRVVQRLRRRREGHRRSAISERTADRGLAPRPVHPRPHQRRGREPHRPVPRGRATAASTSTRSSPCRASATRPSPSRPLAPAAQYHGPGLRGRGDGCQRAAGLAVGQPGVVDRVLAVGRARQLPASGLLPDRREPVRRRHLERADRRRRRSPSRRSPLTVTGITAADRPVRRHRPRRRSTRASPPSTRPPSCRATSWRSMPPPRHRRLHARRQRGPGQDGPGRRAHAHGGGGRQVHHHPADDDRLDLDGGPHGRASPRRIAPTTSTTAAAITSCSVAGVDRGRRRHLRPQPARRRPSRTRTPAAARP